MKQSSTETKGVGLGWGKGHFGKHVWNLRAQGEGRSVKEVGCAGALGPRLVGSRTEVRPV